MVNGYSIADIGFNFTYFGKIYTQVSISTNGYVCFDDNIECSNGIRPSSSDILVGLNVDLNTEISGSGQIYYKTLNDSIISNYVNLINPTFVSNNIFMITYDNVFTEYWVIPLSRVSFQIFLLTDSKKSFVVFKYISCPDGYFWTYSGLNYKIGENSEELNIEKFKECVSSNVKQNGIWMTEVTDYKLGKNSI